MDNIIGIIPCAGKATRLYNLPKFMLPMRDKNMALITNWIHILEEKKCSKIIIGTSFSNSMFINHIIKSQLDHLKHKIILKIFDETETMNETILKCLEYENYRLAIMCMPDTYGDNISDKLIQNVINDDNIFVGAYLWNIRYSQLGKIGQCSYDVTTSSLVDIVDKDLNCKYKYGWGCMIFKPEFEKYILKDDLHIGYSMKQTILDNNKVLSDVMSGMFFDCGTIQGYSEYLNYLTEPSPLQIKGTIIVIAVYINHDENNYNQLITCLKQVRQIYKNNIIVAVDNDSLNSNWYATAKEQNIVVLHNNSKLHKYEMGAYKLALQHFRADKYIFLQGTIYIKNKIDLSLLNINTPNAIAFNTLNSLAWDYDGLNLIYKMFQGIHMNIEQHDINYCVLWNCFCANNLFITDMLNSGLFDIVTNTKLHSCAFERILGVYFKNKLNEINIVDRTAYDKIFLYQI